MKDYVQINRELWNKKTEVHFDSEFYDVPSFRQGRSSLNAIELELLGDIRGKKVLHLQCHFGQDTLSLARLGAEVTGIDLSDKAIEKARQLADELTLDARFICCDLFDLEQHLDDLFDIVFTSYGTIGWLPDLEPWGRIVNRYLKPDGKFLIVEFHPVVWMFDDEFRSFAYSYFNRGPIVEETEGTYADRNAPVKAQSYGWNHSLSDVANALLNQGLRIETFREYDYSPYNCFQNTVQMEKGFQIQGLEGKLPMVYAMKAAKNDCLE
jgi:SAM-dependent methyltransferase